MPEATAAGRMMERLKGMGEGRRRPEKRAAVELK